MLGEFALAVAVEVVVDLAVAPHLPGEEPDPLPRPGRVGDGDGDRVLGRVAVAESAADAPIIEAGHPADVEGDLGLVGRPVVQEDVDLGVRASRPGCGRKSGPNASRTRPRAASTDAASRYLPDDRALRPLELRLGDDAERKDDVGRLPGRELEVDLEGADGVAAIHVLRAEAAFERDRVRFAPERPDEPLAQRSRRRRRAGSP